jgi:hypothetical protein
MPSPTNNNIVEEVLNDTTLPPIIITGRSPIDGNLYEDTYTRRPDGTTWRSSRATNIGSRREIMRFNEDGSIVRPDGGTETREQREEREYREWVVSAEAERKKVESDREKRLLHGNHWAMTRDMNNRFVFVRDYYSDSTPEQAKGIVLNALKQERTQFLREMNRFLERIKNSQQAITDVESVAMPDANTLTDKKGRIINENEI